MADNTSTLEEILKLLEEALSKSRLVSVIEFDFKGFAFAFLLENMVNSLREWLTKKREEANRQQYWPN